MSASLTPPPARRTPARLRWLVAAFGGGVALVLGLAAFVPAVGSVVVENAAFQYDSPPTEFCPFLYTIGGPPASFVEPGGAVFDLSWEVGCASAGPGNATNGTLYEISTVASSTAGFSVVGSDLPVTFGYGTVGLFTVSVRAPGWPGIVVLTLLVGGGPKTASG